jgi:hypothetical protein
LKWQVEKEYEKMNFYDIKADALKKAATVITDVNSPLPDMPKAADYGLSQEEWRALWRRDERSENGTGTSL